MKRLRGNGVASLLMVGMFLAGCYNDGGGAHPLIFPDEGRSGAGSAWGSTVAMLIDSNYIPIIDQDEWHDLSPDRIRVYVRDAESPSPAFDVEARVRAVFDLAPDRWSIWTFVQQGVRGTVVLFDLPSDDAMGNPDYGHEVFVYITVDGAVPPTSDSATERSSPFYLTETGGSPQELMEASYWPGEESWLERPAHAVVRLRAKRGAFTAGQQLGSIEFDFRYNLGGSGYEGCVQQVLAARERTEATGLAMVGPVAGDSQRIVLVSPKGFALTFISEGLYDDQLAGEGPFLDLLVSQGTPDCNLRSMGWFEIHDLAVTDIDGQPLVTQAGLVPVDSEANPDGGAVLRAYLIDPS